MNLHPKVRPLWQRALIVPALTFLMIYKALHLPKRILPRDLRSIVKSWHFSMFWLVIKSGVSRAYIDEPCTFKIPESFQPRTKLTPSTAMNEGEITPVLPERLHRTLRCVLA